MAQQGPPPRSGRTPPPARRREPRYGGRYSWDSGPGPEDDEEYPPWAGMTVAPARVGRDALRQRPMDDQGGGRGAGRPRGPGFRSRAGAARARRARLKLYIWGGAVVVVAAIVTFTLVGLGGQPRPKASTGGLVTSYQPGEMKTVPSACSSVTAALLAQVMQGKPARLAPGSPYGRAGSVCDWTVDAPPVYRHLEITVRAYAPSGLAPGDGSATNAAIAAYQQALRQKVRPPKGTGMPKATVTRPAGLGTAAFAALQAVAAGGDVTDIETVVARVHNVLVTVELQGQARSPTGRYGPVSVARLSSGAVALAHQAVSRLR